jgi:beta-barrel assembly-enhancing protease
MTRALLKLSVVGLGALTLSCAGVQVRNTPNGPRLLVNDSKADAPSGKEDRSDCDKLGALPSDAEEYALGGSIALTWVQRNGGLVSLGDKDNEKLVRYLNVVGKNLGAQSSRPELKWTFGILQNEKSFNALSAPGGYVFVTLGLLRGMDNEAQLAGVLAHEIAHVTKRHVLTRYTETKVKVCKVNSVVSGVMKTVAVSSDRTLADELLSLSRRGGSLNLDEHPELLESMTDKVIGGLDKLGVGKDEEFAADEEAIRLLASAGYDPREYLDVLAKIPERGNSFANHPSKSDRVKRVVAAINAKPDSNDGFQEFAAGTEGLVQPPLPPEAALAKGAVAHDKP